MYDMTIDVDGEPVAFVYGSYYDHEAEATTAVIHYSFMDTEYVTLRPGQSLLTVVRSAVEAHTRRQKRRA